MGFNTVIFFHNDAYGEFKNNPEQTMKNVLMAMDDVPEDKHHYGVGSHANPMKPMKPRHADTDMIYYHSGNTLCEMDIYSQETENLMKNHPEFFERMLTGMNRNLKELKKKYVEVKLQKAIDKLDNL